MTGRTLYLELIDALAGDGTAETGSGRRIVDADERRALCEAVPVTHARYHAQSSLRAITGARQLLGGRPDTDLKAADMGVVTVGGPLSLETAWRLTERLLEKGSRFITPIEFPHAIPSAVPCAVALATGARAFAFAVGHDRTAFFEALVRASQAIHHGLATSVLVAALFDANDVARRAAWEAGMPGLADAAICGLLSIRPPDRPHLALLGVETGHSGEGLEAGLQQFHRVYDDALFAAHWTNGEPSSWPLRLPAAWETCAAAGGVLCWLAAEEVYRRTAPASEASFMVVCRDGDSVGAGVFRWRDRQSRWS
ncbi:hypothetical protein [Azospirillum argentinense]